MGSGNVSVGTVTSVKVAQSGDSSVDKIVIGGDNNITSSGTVKLSHSTSGVTADSYGPTASVSPIPGASFSVPAVTVEKTGHITSAATRTVTMPGPTTGCGLSVEGSGIGIKTVVISVPVTGWQTEALSPEENIYTNTVTDSTNLAHITIDSSPTLDIVMNNITSTSDIDALNEAWSKIYRADSSAHTIKFYATSIPSLDMNVIVKG